MFCMQCGTELPVEANYCWRCGKPQGKTGSNPSSFSSHPSFAEFSVVLEANVTKNKKQGWMFASESWDATTTCNIYARLTDPATETSLFNQLLLNEVFRFESYSDGSSSRNYYRFQDSNYLVAVGRVRQKLMPCLATLASQGWEVSPIANKFEGIGGGSFDVDVTAVGHVRHYAIRYTIHKRRT